MTSHVLASGFLSVEIVTSAFANILKPNVGFQHSFRRNAYIGWQHIILDMSLNPAFNVLEHPWQLGASGSRTNRTHKPSH